MSAGLEIQIIAVIVAVACALPGVFLVLRKMAMLSDSITHTILLGIVLAFFITSDLSSPLLIVGAATMGVITVWLTEMINKTHLVSEDASIGLIFPLLFSIAIILITHFADSVHIDTDSVLLGELAFAPFDRLVIGGVDIGAKAIYSSGALLIINIVVISVFFKELKIVTFDAALAAALGFSPILVHYGIMTLVSLTAVGAFEAVGSVLVVAFMIGPPATAYLLTDDLKKMIILSGIIGAINGIIGYHIAMYWDVSIAGSMATMTGIVFVLVFLFSPKRGLISVIYRRHFQKNDFAKKTLLFHLSHHEGVVDEKIECDFDTIHEHMHWERAYTEKIINSLSSDGNIIVENKTIKMTEQGRLYSAENYASLFS